MDSGGDAVIAFTSGTGAASTDVEVSYRPAGGSFSPPAALTSPTDSAPNCCDHHNLAMSPSGKAIVAYDVCTAASLCSSSTPTAGTRRIDAAIAPVHGPFAAPFAISPTTSVTSAGVTYPVFLESSVAIDDSGDAAVGMAHELSASTAQTEVASSDGGRAFATPAVLDPSGSAPLVAIDASRETVAQWPTASNALASAVRPAAGAFAARTLVATLVAGAPLTALTAGSNLAPASGKVLSAWFGPQGTTGDAHVGAAFRAPGGNFGSPSAPSSTTFGAPSSFASPISAALDQAGNGVIVWLTAANTVQASFNGGTARPAVTKLLTVLRAGSGSGRVQSQDRLIDCGSFCVHAYAQGTVVNLQASAATRSKFTGWAGACTGTGRCSVTLSTVRRVTATFAKAATPAKPTVKIKRHPRSKLKAKRTARVSFGFVAKGITSGFKCKLDRGAFKKCKSPQRYSVRPGRHTFAVEAVGPGGTSKRASFKFTVVRTPPQRHK
jgi:hypothetical protein